MDSEMMALQQKLSKMSQDSRNPAVKIIKKSVKEASFSDHKIEIPSKISSKDTLFGDIVSNIVEKNISESDEDENEMCLLKLNSNGFPEITKLSFPENVQTDEIKKVESGKLEWTLDESEGVSEDGEKNCQIRFGLKGEIMVQNSPNILNNSLYHHGNEYKSAGYTIDELNILSKSTFSSQRALSFNILANIIINLYQNEYSLEQNDKIWHLIQSSNILISARIGLDSNHDTVVDSALNLISAYFGFKCDILDLFDKVILIENGFRTVSLEREWYQRFSFSGEQINCDDSDANNDIDLSNIDSILKILNSDVILGFLLTNIMTRFRYLLTSKSLSIEQRMKIIHILSCIALHSSSSSEDILACTGLVDFLKKIMTECISTYFEDSSIRTLYSAIIRLFRIISLSSKEAAKAILQHGIVDLSMTSLSLTSNDLNLCKQAILLLNVNFCYSIGGSLFDKYHTLIFSCFFTLSQANVFELDRDLVPSSDIFSFISSIAKLLFDVVKNYGNNVDVGGRNDMLYPFVDVLIRIIKFEISSSISNSLQMKGNVFKFLTRYLTKAMENQEISNEIHNLIEIFSVEVIELSRKVFQLFNNISDNNFLPKADIHCFSDLIHAASSDLLNIWLECGEIGDVVGSIFEALLLCAKRNWIAKEILLECRDDPKICKYIVEYCDIYLAKKCIKGFQTIFLVGLNHFFCSFLAYAQYISKKYPNDIFDYSSSNNLLNNLISVLCCSLIPGDDYFLADILEVVLGSNFKDLQLLSIESIEGSKELFGTSSSRTSPNSFLIDMHSKWTRLPLLSLNWIYRYPLDLYKSKIAIDELIFERWILMVESSDFNKIVNLNDSQKFKFILYTYLLHSNNNEPLFRSDKIYLILEKLLKNIPLTKDFYTELDDDAFFQSYQELVHTFISESYGDPVFARNLMVPLSMHMPIRYRLHFWSILIQNLKYIRYFYLESNYFFHQESQFSNIFMDSKEDDMQLIKIYKEVLKISEIPKESALFLILTNI